ncbi:MAG: CBS domain-containing protein [Pseudomonadota bacterium]
MMAGQRVVDLFQQLARNEFGFFSRLESVVDLLDTHVPTVSCDDTFGRLIGRKDARSIGTLGVIDPDDRQLIGVLNQTTIQRCFPRFLNTLAERDEDSRILGTSIVSLVSRPVPKVPSSATPLEAVERFLNGSCDCLFVYDDDKKIVGVVKPIDFLKTMMAYYQLYNQVKPLQRLRLIDLDALQIDEIFFRGAQTARDIMQPLTTLDATENGLTAIKAMHERQSTILGLVGNDQEISSVLTADDMLLALAPPAGIRELAKIANRPDSATEQAMNKLDLLPLDELLESEDPAIQEELHALSSTGTTVIEPTTRIQDVLTHLIEADDGHVLLVKNESTVEGYVTVREILRVNKMLFRIRAWGDNSDASSAD